MEKINKNINKTKECKFCLDSNNQNDMISPCYCKGSLEYVHNECLEYYHSEYENKSDKCGICEYNYNYIIKIKYNTFFKLFFIFLQLYLNNFICIFSCFNQNLYYFSKITLYIYLFYKIINCTNVYYLSIYDITDYNYSKLLAIYNEYYITSNLNLLFYKTIVNIGLVMHNNTIKTFENILILFTLLHFIKIIYFIYKKSTYKQILNIKNY